MRVVIADDSGLLRDGLERLLTEVGVEVAAKVADAAALLPAVQIHQPEVAIVDIRMPPTFTHEGARAALALRAAHPTIGILLLSQVIETTFVADLVRSSPRSLGYLLKDRIVNVSVLRDALRRIAAGETVIDPELIGLLMGNRAVAVQLARLTEREREVLDLMAAGRSNQGIASCLVIDTKTVESHVARILAKLDLPPAPDDHRRVLAVLTWLRR
ncbi:response regulator transcription factor [Pseudofrankia sp. BMG5.37]|uniref:response regulator transcription factor n=1 Tax=Pseudofrankia sp. BMG5.37 TaxID=3050035 RepID=UPI0028940163|nr:response regulator transcription factor [Pseudofrankia sp. BMG5.37]MDT3442692.1 response regulator transcription factor [Pseudofrankia sp. BMG5.37]